MIYYMTRIEAIDAIRSFNRFYTNVIGVVDHHILNSKFSLTEVRILWEIYHDPECNARKIRFALQVDEGYLSRTISKLTREGLIDKRQARDDGRVYVLSLTAEGETVFMDLNRKAAEEIESVVSTLSAKQIFELVSHMKRITQILRNEAK